MEYTGQEREAANKKIAENLSAVDTLLKECQELADKYKLGFSFEGPTYGTGAWYESGEWYASSQSC